MFAPSVKVSITLSFLRKGEKEDYVSLRNFKSDRAIVECWKNWRKADDKFINTINSRN